MRCLAVLVVLDLCSCVVVCVVRWRFAVFCSALCCGVVVMRCCCFVVVVCVVCALFAFCCFFDVC